MNDALRQKINDAFSDYGIIGDVSFSEEEFQGLINYARVVILNERPNEFQKLSDFEAKAVFLSLLEIAKGWNTISDEDNEERGFWRRANSYLNIKASGENYLILKPIIKKLGIPKATVTKKYYATILMHSLSPQKSLFSFFDLCYNLYKNDLDFNFTKEDEYLIGYFATRFAEIFEQGRIGDNQNISIGSGIYTIKVGLREMVKNMKEEFEYLMHHVISNINLLFHNLEMPNDYGGYIDTQMQKWWSYVKIDSFKDKKLFINKGRAVSQQQISLNYILVQEEAYLEIPSIRLNEIGDIWLKITNDGKVIISQRINTRKNNFTVTTVSQKYKLSDLLVNALDIKLQIEITNNGQIIFDSKNKMHRHYILFGEKAEIIKTIIPPNNYFLYTFDSELIIKIQEMIKGKKGHLYNVYPKEGDEISVELQRYTFLNSIKEYGRDRVTYFGNLSGVYWIFEDVKYEVFNNQDKFKLLIPKNQNLSGMELRINDKRQILNDAFVDVYTHDDFYEMDLSIFVKDGYYYEISLYSHKESRVLVNIKAVLFWGLHAEFGSEMIYSDCEKTINISHGDYIQTIHFDLNVDKITLDYKMGYFDILVPWFKWKIDDQPWQNNANHFPTWYKNILCPESILEIDAPISFTGVGKLILEMKNGSESFNFIEIEDNDGKYNLGRKIYSLGEHKEIICFYSVGGIKYDLFVISTKPHFLSKPVIFHDNKLIWAPENSFIGPDDTTFTLTLKGEGEYVFKDLEVTGKLLDSENIIKGFYSYKLTSRDANPFIKVEKSMLNERMRIGSDEELRFKNKYILIDGVSCGYETKDCMLKFNDLTPKYCIDSLELYEHDGQTYYLGRLGILNANGRIEYLDSLKNSDNELDIINPVRVEIVTNNILYLTAGYNLEEPDNYLGDLYYDMNQKRIHNEEKVATNEDCIYNYKFKTGSK